MEQSFERNGSRHKNDMYQSFENPFLRSRGIVELLTFKFVFDGYSGIDYPIHYKTFVVITRQNRY